MHVENLKAMTDKKEQTIHELALDHQAQQLLKSIEHNWEVAASRMEQINQERDEALYDDDGVEVMAVFSRLERVGTMMFSMLSHPQALLLQGFHQQILKMAADHRIDRELVAMMGSHADSLSIGAPTLWKRLKDIFDKGVEESDDGLATVQSLYQQNYIPHMDAEQALSAMQAMVKSNERDEHLTEQMQFMDEMVDFGENIGKIATLSKRKMAVGLSIIQMAVKLFVVHTDLKSKDDEAVDALFEDARKELLKSKAWKEYWRSHIGHLSQKGSIKTELQNDAEEVEQELLDFHRYLYTKMEESAEAFGRALKEAELSDEAMLRLLWLTAKKEAIQKESGGHTPERALMEKGVGEAARKLYQLAADKYYHNYGEIWDDIMLNDIIASQLMNFNGGVHNAGFNMQVFCNIVGWLQREYRFYGSNSSVILGKTLNNGKISDTFKKYIGARETILNQQTINELVSIINKKRN